MLKRSKGPSKGGFLAKKAMKKTFWVQRMAELEVHTEVMRAFQEIIKATFF